MNIVLDGQIIAKNSTTVNINSLSVGTHYLQVIQLKKLPNNFGSYQTIEQTIYNGQIM